jgi:hypothetical protein
VVKKYDYDVTLSFAGEDREYVGRVASYLQKNDIKVFYDDFKKVELWGKNLIDYLSEIYQKKAKYCVIFSSKHYVEKIWTNHERKNALARAIGEKKEYILPARFDNTELPGILPTIGYIDISNLSPEEFGQLIIQKVNNEQSNIQQIKKNYRKPKVSKRRSFNPYQEIKEIINFITSEIKGRCEDLSKDGVSCSIFKRDGRVCIRILFDNQTVYSLDISMGGGIGGDDSIGFYGIEGKMTSISSGSFNAWAHVKWSQTKDSAVIILNDMSLLDTFSTDEKEYTKSEFLEALWNKICEVLENK